MHSVCRNWNDREHICMAYPVHVLHRLLFEHIRSTLFARRCSRWEMCEPPSSLYEIVLGEACAGVAQHYLQIAIVVAGQVLRPLGATSSAAVSVLEARPEPSEAYHAS